jgi:hypothetical protein
LINTIFQMLIKIPFLRKDTPLRSGSTYLIRHTSRRCITTPFPYRGSMVKGCLVLQAVRVDLIASIDQLNRLRCFLLQSAFKKFTFEVTSAT